MMRKSSIRHGVLVFLLAAMATSLALTGNPEHLPGGWATGTTGGKGGEEVTVSTPEEFDTQARKSGPMILWVKGTLKGDCRVRADDKTILGEPGAAIEGTLEINGIKNVIIRNLLVHITTPCTGTSGAGTCEEGPDAVHVESATNVWLDHLSVLDGNDGNMDFTKAADSITVTWCKFSYTRTGLDHQFSNLIGNADNQPSDSGRFNCTFHHCWWGDLVRERMPRVRYGKVHLYNNLFSSVQASHCIRVGFMANILAEANAFIGTRNPVNYYDVTGVITMRGNYFRNTTGDTASRGTAFVPGYPYEADDAATVENTVRADAGNTITSWSTGVIARPAKNGRYPEAPVVRLEGRSGTCCIISLSPVPVDIEVYGLSGRLIMKKKAVVSGAAFTLPGNGRVWIIRTAESGSASMYLRSPAL